MFHRSSTLGPIAGALLAAAALPARAADLDYGYGSAPPPIVAESKVEFGSGWYVRGDIGAARLPTMQLGPSALPTENNIFVPPAPAGRLTSGSDVGFVASLAGGYQFNRFFRTDLMFDYHQPVVANGSTANEGVFCPTAVTYPDKVTNADGSITWGTPDYGNGGCTGNYTARLNSYDVLVNGYVDLVTFHGVTPYVGAGIGLSFGHYQTGATYVQANGVPYHVSYAEPKYGITVSQNFDRNASGNYYNFAFAAMAGVAVDVYPHTKLDIGYRYLNLGRVANLGGSLYENEVRAGLRYMVDN